MRCSVLILAVAACGPPLTPAPNSEVPEMDPPRVALMDPPRVIPPVRTCAREDGFPSLGAHLTGDRLEVKVRSRAATRVLVELFDAPRFSDAVVSYELTKEGDIFSTQVSRSRIPIEGTIYYGLRAWGPNWPFEPGWTRGSTVGLVAHVDGDGNRFNPNKLLIDPYARELSHDPLDGEWRDFGVYLSGDQHFARDSGPYAPKGIVLDESSRPCWERPATPMAESVVYEVHVRGFTRQDPNVPEAYRGTYRGAAAKAEYLAELGVTAIELLPVHETQNDQNDLEEGADGDNYWGYASWSFFAPDRRYAYDRSPGGPTRELQAMVRAFHRVGIEVFVDVVYNHTAEGSIWGDGLVGPVLSWRGLDNAAYYQLDDDPRFYANNNGVSANVDATDPMARDMVIDSLVYMRDVLGIDGFRFDLASVLGNACERTCFRFDRDDSQGILRRAAELEGVKLIAEPWGLGPGTYQIGNFPPGWAEWNGIFRDTIRRDQNGLGVEAVTPGEIVGRLLGSPDLFGDDGRGPVAAINYIASHDGFTLRDVYSYDEKVNGRDWPYGPSPGGDDHNFSWDHGGDPDAQRQAARTGLALVMVSAGVPMITGGDEMYRTQHGNNNPFNLDSPAMWLDWEEASHHPEFLAFARNLIWLRRTIPAFRSQQAEVYGTDGMPVDGAYLGDPNRHYVGLLRGGTYVAYNGWREALRVELPHPGVGRVWRRVVDTGAWMESNANHQALDEAEPIEGRIYDVSGRSVVLFVAGDEP